MAYCESCIKVNPINRCADSFYIPVVSGAPDGDYNVILTDTTTGRVENIAVTAVGNTLTVVLTGIELQLAHTYKVEVYEGGNYNEKRNMTIGVTEGCCLEFETLDLEVGVGTNEILSLDTCE